MSSKSTGKFQTPGALYREFVMVMQTRPSVREERLQTG
jgi:hypothetical protein